MRAHNKILVSLICLLLLSLTGWTQKGLGKLAGKISETAGNQTISGVNVSAKSIGKGTQSITDGSYILALPAGTYTISFSHKSYQTKEISDVVIKAGETTDLNIILVVASTQLQGVVVTTSIRRESQSAIYNKQKTSSAESDGISIEAIRKTPDNNAGQIMKRITGVNVQDNRFVVVRGLSDQYNQTMLNGVLMSSTESNRNAFALDLIPSAVIDNIVVNKTATPDMPGNFAGGIVQINTKDFPANNFFSIELGAGFASQTIGKDFYSDPRGKFEWLGFGTSIRELPDNFPRPTNRQGAIDQLNFSEQQRYLRQIKNNIVPMNQGPSGPNTSFQLGFGKTIRFKNESQFGIVFAATNRKTELIEQETTARDPLIDQLKSTPSTPNVTGLNYYSENTRYRYYSNLGGVLNLAYSFGKNKITLKTLYTQIFNNLFVERPNVRASESRFPSLGANGYGLTYFAEQKGILNTILGGDHRTGIDNETHLDWNVNITQINTNTPDIRNFVFSGYKDSLLSSNVNQSSAEQALQQNGRTWAEDKDFVYGGAFNITTPFYISGSKQFFKAGLLYQNRERKATAVIVIYKGLQNTLDSLLAPDNFYSLNGAGLSSFGTISAANGTYNAGSSLLAAYSSVENRIGEKLRVIWGIRAENYQQYVNTFNTVYYPNFNNYDLRINSLAARTTFNFLPSINLVYALSNKINLRAAYSSTVVRPELKDLAAFPRYNYLTFSISQGNPALKSTSIQNYDFKFEFFPSSGEILSLAAFYKKLKDPIEYARNPTQEQYLQPLNAGSATVEGIEVEIRKRIDFISSADWLKNVTLFGNGSLIHSEVPEQTTLNDNIFPSLAAHTLTGQPPYIINAGINISALKNSFDFSLTFNRTGDYIFQLGSADLVGQGRNRDVFLQTPNVRVNPRNQLDLVVSQSLMKNKLRLRFSVNNLLSEPFIIYQDVNENKKLDDFIVVKPTGDIDAGYVSGTDGMFSNIKGQIGYFFYVSYSF